MSTQPPPRKMPDTLWLAEVMSELGFVAAAIKGKGSLSDALSKLTTVLLEWEEDLANANNAARLTASANGRIRSRIALGLLAKAFADPIEERQL